MSKSGKPSASVNSSKSGLNPNTPNYNPSHFRWQSTFTVPSVSHQLALPPTSAPPGMWTPIGAPITQGFGYGYPFAPRYGPPPPVGPHSNYCCLANQRHQCGGCDHNFNGWPTPGSNPWSNNRDDNHNNNNNNNKSSPTNGVAITEVKDDGKDDLDEVLSTDSDFKDKKEIRELKQTNEDLVSTLEETKQRLRETQELLLKSKEQTSNDSLDYYRKNLRKYGDFIREEVNRFYQNEEMAKKLKPIVEQLSIASQHIKEDKERTRQSILTARQMFKDNKDLDFGSNLFNPQSVPDLPDLLTFYKNILDEIPLIFLNDLTQLKILSNTYIQKNSKNKLSNNGLPMSSPFGDEPTPSLKPLHSVSNSLFSAPNISELPKPDFNTLPLKPVAVEPTEQPALELNFPRNSSPVPLPDSITNDSPISSTPLLDIIPLNKTKEKTISPIGKPLQPVIDLMAFCSESAKNKPIESNSQQTNNWFDETQPPKKTEVKLETDPIRPPMNPIPRFQKQKQTAVEAPKPEPVIAPVVEAPKSALNQAQSRLLVKLREKYPQMTDSHLIDSMAQTKAVLIASGNPKGFSGMKVVDIINKISEYIDTKVLSNNFSKPRLTDMKSSAQNNINSIADGLANASLKATSKKGWNTVNSTAGKYDDSICSICFESISMTTRYETNCNHFFHHSCISNWTRKDGSCPICRRLVLPPGEFPEL